MENTINTLSYHWDLCWSSSTLHTTSVISWNWEASSNQSVGHCLISSFKESNTFIQKISFIVISNLKICYLTTLITLKYAILVLFDLIKDSQPKLIMTQSQRLSAVQIRLSLLKCWWRRITMVSWTTYLLPELRFLYLWLVRLHLITPILTQAFTNLLHSTIHKSFGRLMIRNRSIVWSLRTWWIQC